MYLARATVIRVYSITVNSRWQAVVCAQIMITFPRSGLLSAFLYKTEGILKWKGPLFLTIELISSCMVMSYKFITSCFILVQLVLLRFCLWLHPKSHVQTSSLYEVQKRMNTPVHAGTMGSIESLSQTLTMCGASYNFFISTFGRRFHVSSMIVAQTHDTRFNHWLMRQSRLMKSQGNRVLRICSIWISIDLANLSHIDTCAPTWASSLPTILWSYRQRSSPYCCIMLQVQWRLCDTRSGLTVVSCFSSGAHRIVIFLLSVFFLLSFESQLLVHDPEYSAYDLTSKAALIDPNIALLTAWAFSSLHRLSFCARQINLWPVNLQDLGPAARFLSLLTNSRFQFPATLIGPLQCTSTIFTSFTHTKMLLLAYQTTQLVEPHWNFWSVTTSRQSVSFTCWLLSQARN